MPIRQSEIEELSSKIHQDIDIISKEPNWLIRNGVMVFASVIISMIIISYLIKYPDIVRAEAHLTTQNPPIKLIAKATGKLQIIGSMGDLVNKNTPLGYIESTVDFNQANELLGILDSMKRKNVLRNRLKINNKFDRLGIFQSILDQLLLKEKDLIYLEANTPYRLKIQSINKEIKKTKELLYQKHQELEIINKEYSLTEKDFNRNKYLWDQSVISEKDYELSHASLLAAKKNVQAIKTDIIQIELRIISLEKDIIDIKNLEFNNSNQTNSTYLDLFNTLHASLLDWRDSYTFFSPISGRLIAHEQRSNEQSVMAGEHLFSIIPQEVDSLKAFLQVPTINSGKIKIGQGVNIYLDDYPYEEFGVIKGTLSNITQMQLDKFYLVEVSINNTELITTNKKKIDYRANMRGYAEILTEDLRLIDRFFYQFKKLIGKNN